MLTAGGNYETSLLLLDNGKGSYQVSEDLFKWNGKKFEKYE
ncbi:hypothetical protein [Niastella koreensis]|nr:hypothetical protein [Niastella koreensis]